MSSVTMAHFKVVSHNESEIVIEVSSLADPVRIEVHAYDSGVILQIPWYYRGELGEPHYEALKRIVRPHFEGLIQTRTQTDPRFTRAAKARAGCKANMDTRQALLESHPA